MAITLTEKAASEIRDLLTQQGKPDATLRIWVASGGCSGLQYGMAIDEEQPTAEDQIFESNGVKIAIDPLSLNYMIGSEVDYLDDQLGGGFKIENPNAVKGCGCGHSFQTEDGAGDEANSGSGCGGCSSAG